MSSRQATTGEPPVAPRTLGALLVDLARVETPARRVAGVTLDTRQLAPGYLYLALAGGNAHGLDFVDDAIERGATTVAIDVDDVARPDQLERLARAAVALVRVAELKRHAGEIAARFHGMPSRTLTVVAVTGTDGKTSVCRFLQQALTALRGRCGYIGTLGWGLHEPLKATTLTTPDATSLQAMLASMRADGADIVVLEASSHGIAEGRLTSLDIDVAALTNFGRDHLDYHRDLESYRAAKASLFDWPGLHAIVVNGDDSLGRSLDAAHAASSLRRVRFHPHGEVGEPDRGGAIVLSATDVQPTDDGLAFTIVEHGARGAAMYPVSLPLIGHFNVDNVLACHGVLRSLDVSANDASVALNAIRPVAGRMERFVAPAPRRDRPLVVVDYAHTPQALESAIRAARAHTSAAVWLVFGCGGDRDPGKRAPMGRAAEAADHRILTDDNPRTEDAVAIRAAVRAGMRAPDAVVEIGDRRAAIEYAITHAQPDDVVLIAGKGHEDYQIVGQERLEFSDRDWAVRLLAGGAS